MLDRIKELVEKYEFDYLQLRQMIIQLRIEANNRIETRLEVQQLRLEIVELQELLQRNSLLNSSFVISLLVLIILMFLYIIFYKLINILILI